MLLNVYMADIARANSDVLGDINMGIAHSIVACLPTWPTILKPTGISSRSSSGSIAFIISTISLSI